MGAEEDPPPVEAIHLLPLGPVPQAVVEDLAGRLSRQVPVSCRVLEPAGIEPLRLSHRDQLDADALLLGLESRATAAHAVLVGITTLDIAIPIFTFVFGRARQGGRAALVSLARLDPVFYGLPPDPDLRARRARDELLHELGHVASLTHCADAACLMSFAGAVEKVDVRGSTFCPPCHDRLPRWLRGEATPSG